LSPYLFILAIDTLQYVLKSATDRGLLSPLRDRTAQIRLSLYADNAVVFINPIKQEVDLIIDIMRHFRDATVRNMIFGLENQSDPRPDRGACLIW
jgi:uncharacterized protein YheU (UPF0270 family)